MTPTLFMLIGPPGCGKSYFIDNIFFSTRSRKDWVVISSDDYIMEKAAEHNISTYNEAFPKFIKEATKHVELLAKNASLNRSNVIWDQTNLTVKTRASKLAHFKQWDKRAIYFEQPPEFLWRQRLAQRPGKTIPQGILDNMIKSIEKPSKAEGFCYIASFDSVQNQLKELK